MCFQSSVVLVVQRASSWTRCHASPTAALFPVLCHLLSVAEVHVLFILSQSDCILCMSAVPVFHRGYSLVLLFVVRLDNFVSCCNSCCRQYKRLAGMTKLCCSWLGIRGEADQTFCWLGQEVGLFWNKWESCSSSHDSNQLRPQAVMWKYNIIFSEKISPATWHNRDDMFLQGLFWGTGNRRKETVPLVYCVFWLVLVVLKLGAYCLHIDMNSVL